MAGKRVYQQPCSSCGRLVRDGKSACGCGTQTPFLSFDERNQYELESWRAFKEQQSA